MPPHTGCATRFVLDQVNGQLTCPAKGRAVRPVCNKIQANPDTLLTGSASVVDFLLNRSHQLLSLQLDHNHITVLPRCIGGFSNLVALDISNNAMTYMSREIALLSRLRTLTARNNRFDNAALPKELATMQSLRVVNFSGNRLEEFPLQFTQLLNLQCLHLGANRLVTLPDEIGHLQR